MLLLGNTLFYEAKNQELQLQGMEGKEGGGEGGRGIYKAWSYLYSLSIKVFVIFDQSCSQLLSC